MLPLSLFIACSPDPAPSASPPPAQEPAPAPEPEEDEAPAEAGRPPVIGRVVVSPTRPRVTDELVVEVEATDPDGDLLDLDYAWFADGQELVGRNSERLDAGEARKGQRVRVDIVASDGKAEVRASSVEVVVKNTDPVFTGDPTKMTRVDGYRFVATDVDGDEIRWRLDGGPPGLSISTGGVLAYRGSPSDPGGDYTVNVYGEDGEGRAQLSFPMSVKPGSDAGKKAEAEK